MSKSSTTCGIMSTTHCIWILLTQVITVPFKNVFMKWVTSTSKLNYTKHVFNNIINYCLFQSLCESKADFFPHKEALSLRHNDEDMESRVMQLQKTLKQIQERLEEKVHILAYIIHCSDKPGLCSFASVGLGIVTYTYSGKLHSFLIKSVTPLGKTKQEWSKKAKTNISPQQEV